jgi:signal transduction histidine kinase
MSLGQQVQALDVGADETHMDAESGPPVGPCGADENQRIRAWLRTEVVPGLRRLDDPRADLDELRAVADEESRRLRSQLEALGEPDGDGDDDPAGRQARHDAHEIVRGQLHDGALQILEFVAGGLGTTLTAPNIAILASKVIDDLCRWIDEADESAATELLPKLEEVTAEARSLHAPVELVPGPVAAPIGAALTREQVDALVGAVREAVTNARKHAKASHIIVRLEITSDGGTAVTVTDDGVGIDPELIASARGLGVKTSIVGRMNRIGGHASLDGAPGGGTQVKLITSRQGA